MLWITDTKCSKEVMQTLDERQSLEGTCDFCGKKTLDENYEVIGASVVLEKEERAHPSSEVLGEWCSVECFWNDLHRQVMSE